jgi:uncharacterized protein YecE (DUF72 family)
VVRSRQGPICERGQAGGRYKGRYRDDALADWAKRIQAWNKQGCDVFVYFDNDQKSAAPADALKLRQLLG